MARKWIEIPARAATDDRLTMRDLRVMMAIAKCVDFKTRGNFIKRETLVELTGISIKRISVQTARLQKYGYLIKRGNGGRNRPAYYQLCAETVTESGGGLDAKRLPNQGEVKAETVTDLVPKRLPIRGEGKDTPLTLKTKTPISPKEKSLSVKKSKTGISDIVLPDWLPPEAWEEFVQHRQEIKKPLKRRAAKLAISTLEKLHAAGNDPVEVINQSILSAWPGLWEIKRGNQRNGKRNANDGNAWLHSEVAKDF